MKICRYFALVQMKFCTDETRILDESPNILKCRLAFLQMENPEMCLAPGCEECGKVEVSKRPS